MFVTLIAVCSSWSAIASMGKHFAMPPTMLSTPLCTLLLNMEMKKLWTFCYNMVHTVMLRITTLRHLCTWLQEGA